MTNGILRWHEDTERIIYKRLGRGRERGIKLYFEATKTSYAARTLGAPEATGREFGTSREVKAYLNAVRLGYIKKL